MSNTFRVQFILWFLVLYVILYHRLIAFWLFDHAPLGWLAPYVLALALHKWPHKVR